jgi:FAD binding domain in molybdopterin dehydrogenase
VINFLYARANDVADATRKIAADPTAKFITGGPDLIALMKQDVDQPTGFIDITRLPLNTGELIAGGGLQKSQIVFPARARASRLRPGPGSKETGSNKPVWRSAAWPAGRGSTRRLNRRCPARPPLRPLFHARGAGAAARPRGLRAQFLQAPPRAPGHH